MADGNSSSYREINIFIAMAIIITSSRHEGWSRHPKRRYQLESTNQEGTYD